ncbi:MAG: nuclear transport factor 2 family protein [Acidobacteriota bacterium]|nr:nuclear transport factor 2 family protein [Acidobacteriota bacterium]
MKQTIILTLILIASAINVFGQAKDKRTETIGEEIKKMDRQWQVESYGSKDLKDFDRIVADDFSMIGSNGKTIPKAEKRANIVADHTEPIPNSIPEPDSVFKIDEASHQVRVFKDAAVSNGYIIEKYVYKGNKVDSRVYFTCTYLKRNGRWQAVAAHYTRIKQS